MENIRKNIENVFFNKKGVAYVFLTCVAFFAYAQTLFYDITYSDDHVLVGSHYDFNKDLSNIDEAFEEDIFKTPVGYGSYYRPILRLSFMLDAQFGQGSVIFLSHLTNILLHVVVSCVLMALLIKVGAKKEWAFLLSLMFAVHPLHAQTVALIASRNDSLLAIFVLLGFFVFLNYIENANRKNLYLSTLLFALALFTKETAIVFPFLCFFYVLLFKKEKLKSWKSYFILALCWLGVVLLWLWARSVALGNFVSKANFDVLDSIKENYLATIPQIGKMLLPFKLSPFPVLEDMNFVYGYVAIIFFVLWFLLSKEKNWKMVFFGIVWIFIFMFFSILKPSGQIPEFSEHRLYISTIGFCFVVLGMGRIHFMKNTRGMWFLLLIGLVFLLFLSMTMHRNQFYKDGITFWAYASDSSPSRAFNLNNLGAMYFLRSNFEKAEVYYKKALELNPKEPLANYNLGLIYEKKGDYEEAKNSYLRESNNSDYDPTEALKRIDLIKNNKD